MKTASAPAVTKNSRREIVEGMRKLSPILDVTSPAPVLGEARSSLLVLAHKAKGRRPLLLMVTKERQTHRRAPKAG